EGAGSSDAGERAGVVGADGKPFPHPTATAKRWVPVPGGPAFLLGPNFYSVRSYNPSMNYTLSIVLLGDRVLGGEPLVQKFPGSERAPTLAEVQEIQRRLTALGYDTGGTDGRVGNDTMSAVQNFQRKIGMQPADGYAGVGLLARLRAPSSPVCGAPPPTPIETRGLPPGRRQTGGGPPPQKAPLRTLRPPRCASSIGG